jgi:DNA-binding transcriptional LysR family regulator
MAVFVRVVERGSLTAAGRDMRLSTAVVSNRIARLEASLGVRLLNRTTHRVDPTRQGTRFYEHCLTILSELEQAENAICDDTTEPRGPIKVTAPAVFGRLHVAPHVPAFLARYPQMQVRLRLTDHLLDLSQEQIDLALRVAEMTNSNAIVRKLAPNRRMIVASPDYLERHGAPKEPADLLKHNCMLLRFSGSPQFRWTLQTPDGPVTLRVAGNMEADNSEVLREWCVAGHGLALESLWEIVDELNTGRLVVVLPTFRPLAHALYALYPQNRLLSSRVRVFIDFLAEIYGPRPPWEQALKVELP